MVDSRVVLVGDWSRLVRDPLDLLRIGFAVAAVVYGVFGFGGAVNLGVAAVAVIAVRFLNLPQPYDLAFIACMWLTGWGEALRLYDKFVHYDVVVHFLVPLLGAPIVYIALSRLDVLSEPREHEERHHYVGLFLVTLAFGLALGAAWRSSSGAPTTSSGASSRPARATRSATSLRTRAERPSAARCSSPGRRSAGERYAESRRAPSRADKGPRRRTRVACTVLVWPSSRARRCGGRC